MDYRQMAARLLARLRKETNGAAVGDMDARGLRYRYNYGVALHSIRREAGNFAPDSGFAEYLWLQPVRELRLAAPTIADPQKLTVVDLNFWFNGIDNIELAENAASFLFARSAAVCAILNSYGLSGDRLKRYAALLSVARGDISDVPVEKVITYAVEAARKGNPQLTRAAALMLSNAARYEDKKAEIEDFVERIRSSAQAKEHEALLNELFI